MISRRALPLFNVGWFFRLEYMVDLAGCCWHGLLRLGVADLVDYV